MAPRRKIIEIDNVQSTSKRAKRKPRVTGETNVDDTINNPSIKNNPKQKKLVQDLSLTEANAPNNETSRFQSKVNILKNRLISYRNYFESFIDSVPPYFEIKSRLSSIDQIYREFLGLLNGLVSILDNTDSNAIQNEIDDFESLYHSLNAKCNILISTNEHSQNLTPMQCNQNKFTKKLPDIDIPSFDGKPENWLTFKDTYTALIHNNSEIDDIVKFTYLLNKLKGDAKASIGHITLSSAGYLKAWNILEHRFNNKRILIDLHLDALLNLPSLNKESSVELRNLLNLVTSHVSSLEACEQKIEGIGELLLINIVCKKIDSSLRKDWENQLSLCELPNWSRLVQFLENKCRVFESLVPNKGQFLGGQQLAKTQNKFNFIKNQTRNNPMTSNYLIANANSETLANKVERLCLICNKSYHPVFICTMFLEMTVSDRYKKIKDLGLCTNCFRLNHSASTCYFKGCKFCFRKHHSLLHINSNESLIKPETASNMPKSTNSKEVEVQSVFYSNAASSKLIILSTALILIKDRFGKLHEARALLDSASQSNFISSSFAKRFQFNTKCENLSITGLDKNKTQIAEKVISTIKSHCSKYKKNMEFLIVSKISNSLPQSTFDISRWSIPPNIKLADPSFNVAAPVDILIGAEIFFEILCSNKYQFKENFPILQETQFGWVLNGKYEERDSVNFANFNTVISDSDDDLNIFLKRFWEVENLPITKHISDEERRCETFFVQTHMREKSGRYKVFLPLKDNIKNLGHSRTPALKRFLNLEKNLDNNLERKKMYSNFIKEYLALNHMKLSDENDDELSYYMPHHSVLKPSSSTTKLRVVFDASAETTTNLSLNKCMMKGPNVQEDLFNIILRFRRYKYVITCDISKMYRQVTIDSSQTALQRILWRFNSNEAIKAYELTTVTYGTAAAPFLATRVLNQLAEDEEISFPIAAKVVKRDFYVDDCLTGANSIDEVMEIQKQLINMLESAGFHLHKWSSNENSLLHNVSNSDKEKLGTNEISCKGTIKTLGLNWNPEDDLFTFNVATLNENKLVSKRSVLADTCKLFDPLGLISPVIVTAKKFIQELWRLKVGWDEKISDEMINKWNRFKNKLKQVNEIQFERNVMIDNAQVVELHGFADASQDAFGACIYVKSIDNNRLIKVALLCSKSRVAPLKTISVPRLELMAAHLLAILISKVASILEIPETNIWLWSDSTIVLTWINTEPYKLKTFVANRVCQIQELTEKMKWQHVQSAENPADLISRGLMPDELGVLDMWWHGPHFINQIIVPMEDQFLNFETNTDVLEYKLDQLALPTFSVESFSLLHKYSSFEKLLRVTAYVLRFINNCKHKNARKSGNLSVNELKVAITKLVCYVQARSFCSEIACLKKGAQIASNSKLKSLNPFIDNENVLRVGGRLQNSDLDYNCKHPIILPSNNNFTELIFHFEHIRNLHAGPQLLLSIVRQQFWPINGKNCAKQTYRKCIKCFRAKPIMSQQIMGHLPTERVTPSRSFSNTGIDFCGPFLIKNKRQRNSALIKVYISVFICLFSKAVHLEIVSDLSTETFLASLKRFTSRRGKPHTIWSDNGTNFIGANNELKRFYKLITNEYSESNLSRYCLFEQITWKFIPPRSPNFGGLWEASVKSLKSNLKRVASGVPMSYEELNTLIIQIEGIMNSRPLSTLPDSPTDTDPLTPGHFLIGGPITALVEPSYLEVPESHLSSWRKVTKMTQSFWKRFSTEYIHTLQQRTKWKGVQANLQVNDIVLLMDENLPSILWLMGRITSAIKGTDGLVRVVEVKTRNGVYKRSISKIAKLPV